MKILLADDHKLFRAGLMLVLQQIQKDLTLIEAGTGQEALQRVEDTSDLTLVLLDLDLPGGNGMEVLRSIRVSHPKLPVVMLSALEDTATVTRAMEAGANGFIPKSASGEVMINSLNLVLSGGVCLPPGYADMTKGPRGAEELPNLTRRQLEVLRLMATGSSNKEIARDLDISENTVRVHISAIISALDATNRTEAAYSAMRLGLIPRAVPVIE